MYQSSYNQQKLITNSISYLMRVSKNFSSMYYIGRMDTWCRHAKHRKIRLFDYFWKEEG